jgi:hypothetical protein
MATHEHKLKIRFLFYIVLLGESSYVVCKDYAKLMNYDIKIYISNSYANRLKMVFDQSIN